MNKRKWLIIILFALVATIGGVSLLTQTVVADDPLISAIRDLQRIGAKGIVISTDDETFRRLQPLGVQRAPTPPAEIRNLPTPRLPEITYTPAPYPIRTRVTGPCRPDPELFTYIATRHEALQKADPRPTESDRIPATVTFKRPVQQVELDRLISSHRLFVGNKIWVSNSDITGICGNCTQNSITPQPFHSSGALLRVEGFVAINVQGLPEDLQKLANDPLVVLVDPGKWEPIGGGVFGARRPEHVYWRYERACR